MLRYRHGRVQVGSSSMIGISLRVGDRGQCIVWQEQTFT